MAKARPDKYDIIGLALLALLAIVWVAHFVLPAPPPEPPPDAVGETSGDRAGMKRVQAGGQAAVTWISTCEPSSRSATTA
jgi:hypothetical protein